MITKRPEKMEFKEYKNLLKEQNERVKFYLQFGRRLLYLSWEKIKNPLLQGEYTTTKFAPAIRSKDKKGNIIYLSKQ